jgi:predicted  nucleic acid-binding Zn-ribbon protein
MGDAMSDETTYPYADVLESLEAEKNRLATERARLDAEIEHLRNQIREKELEIMHEMTLATRGTRRDPQVS